MNAINDARAEYRSIRARSHADSAATFDAAVRALLGAGEHAPAAWLRAAREVTFPCRRCAATGVWARCRDLNTGAPIGSCGTCFRCGGKGHQNDADAVRNAGADRAMFLEAARAMVA